MSKGIYLFISMWVRKKTIRTLSVGEVLERIEGIKSLAI
jgi:hypothetical protein